MNYLFYYFSLNNIYIYMLLLYFTIKYLKRKAKIKIRESSLPPNLWKKNGQKCLYLQSQSSAHGATKLCDGYSWPGHHFNQADLSTRSLSAESSGGPWSHPHYGNPHAGCFWIPSPCWARFLPSLLNLTKAFQALGIGLLYRRGTEVRWVSLLNPARKGQSWGLNQDLVMLKLCPAVCSRARPLNYNN